MVRTGAADGPIEQNTRPAMPACMPRTKVVSTDDDSPARSPTARMSLRCIRSLTSSGEWMSKWPDNFFVCSTRRLALGLRCPFAAQYTSVYFNYQWPQRRHHRHAGATPDRSFDGRDVLARAVRRRDAGPRLGARVRRGGDPAGGGGVGRTRGDAVADHPGGRQGRPVLPGVVRAAGRRTQRAGHADGVRGDVLG